jgi:hypothetical protein
MYRCTFIACLLILACNNQPAATKNTSATNKKQYYPYSPLYQTDFTKGDEAKANTVLNIWKGYESGNFSSYLAHFAEDVTMVFENDRFTDKKDIAVEKLRVRRKHITTTQIHVEYWQPVFMPRLQEHWVFIWGRFEGTIRRNDLESWNIHQVWKFNKDGKIYFMQEYKSRFEWSKPD